MADDWAVEAAKEIATRMARHYDWAGRGLIAETAIIKHCPFKPNVAYMPVPLCQTCVHWDREEVTIAETAECLHPNMSAIVHWSDDSLDIPIHFRMRTKPDFGCTEFEHV